jgi:hypothetical protein
MIELIYKLKCDRCQDQVSMSYTGWASVVEIANLSGWILNSTRNKPSFDYCQRCVAFFREDDVVE